MHFDLFNRLLVEYAINALWLVPMLTAAAWLLVRAARLGPQGEHRVWLAVLALCVMLPLRGLSLPKAHRTDTPPAREAVIALPEVSSSPALEEMTVAKPVSTPTAATASSGLDGQTRLTMSPVTLRNLSALYAALVSLTLIRLTRSILSANKLLNSSTAFALNEEDEVVWQQLNESLRLNLPASTVRMATQIASPVVIGLLRPTLLVPANFGACSGPERRAALAHELAHIARRDTLIHALSQVMALPLIWHPLIFAVQTQIARTREMICDAIAASTMDSGFVYAHCLLSLAQRLLRDESSPQPGAAMGLFRNHKLEERVIRLTEVNPHPTTAQRWIRGGAAVSAVLLTGAAAALVHVTPVLADKSQETTQTQSQTVSPVKPSAPPAPAMPAVPALAPPAPSDAASHSDVPLQNQLGELNNHGRSIAIAHGKNRHVIVRDGGHIHRWIGADGQPWELMNDQVADLTPQQQQDAEAEYWQKLAQAESDLKSLRLKFNSPEFKQQIDSMTKGEIAKQLAELKNMPEIKVDLDGVNTQIKDLDINLKGLDVEPMTELKDLQIDPQIKLDLNALKSEDFAGKNGLVVHDGKLVVDQLSPADQRRIDEQMEQAKRQVKEAMAKMNDPAFAAQIAAQRKAAAASSAEAAKRMEEARRRMDDATKRMEAATKALEEAQKQMEKK